MLAILFIAIAITQQNIQMLTEKHIANGVVKISSNKLLLTPIHIMIKPETDLELSIKALEVYGVPSYLINNMLSNLKKLVDKINKPKEQ